MEADEGENSKTPLDEEKSSEEKPVEEKSSDDRPSDDRPKFKAVCSECGSDCEVPFEPTEGKPVRCNDCFKKFRSNSSGRFGNRSSGGGGGRFNNNNNRRSFRDDRPREKHKAVCSECGKDCEVPFKPRDGQDVKCNDCFRRDRF
ncbi:hypothetical protein GOV12_02180 [Candidatus Pacearchaeota archaeon]|nr:hypothetical protein [Candidatus Pacearchaeota archaeon]